MFFLPVPQISYRDKWSVKLFYCVFLLKKPQSPVLIEELYYTVFDLMWKYKRKNETQD